jgi:hypothetical protein
MSKKVISHSVGDTVIVRGPGFEFKKYGKLSVFKQTGACPSLRAAREISKALAQQCGS